MDAIPHKFAYRCLPLVIANQLGWQLSTSTPVTATWDGGSGQGALSVDGQAVSHFGHGVLTFHPGYLFRTAPGVQLLATGPLNQPKDGIQALSGVVETDWAVATWTMNWRFTRPGTVHFEVGEAFCQIIPLRLGLVDGAEVQVEQMPADVYVQHAEWSRSRNGFNNSPRGPEAWERHYFQGTSPGGVKAAEHRTKISVYVKEADLSDHLPVVVKDDFLAPEEAQHLAALLEESATHDRGDAICESRPDPSADEVLGAVVGRVADTIAAAYGEQVDVETVLFSRMLPGARHAAHADAELPDGSPNHTPHRTHVGLVYLRASDGGGVLRVWDGENGGEGSSYPPNPGRLVAFPATRRYMHEVSPVEGGERWALAIWVRRAAH